MFGASFPFKIQEKGLHKEFEGRGNQTLINDTDPIRQIQHRPLKLHEFSEPAQKAQPQLPGLCRITADVFQREKPIRKFSSEITSPIRKRLRTPSLRTLFLWARSALKGTNLRGQTEPKRRFSLIFADSRPFLENKAVPWPSHPCFFWFRCFFRFLWSSLLFCAFFLAFPSILGFREEKTPCFFGESPVVFLYKKLRYNKESKGWGVRVGKRRF